MNAYRRTGSPSFYIPFNNLRRCDMSVILGGRRDLPRSPTSQMLFAALYVFRLEIVPRPKQDSYTRPCHNFRSIFHPQEFTTRLRTFRTIRNVHACDRFCSTFDFDSCEKFQGETFCKKNQMSACHSYLDTLTSSPRCELHRTRHPRIIFFRSLRKCILIN